MKDSISSKLKGLVYFENRSHLIPDYEMAYSELPEGVLDKDFMVKITDDNPETRLSEISISHFVSKLGFDSLSGKSHGPDLVIETPDGRLNIEIVTPKIAKSSKGNTCVINMNTGEQHTEEIVIVDMMSLKARISSVFRTKFEQYKKWNRDGIISNNDTNLVLINLGYIEHLINDEMKSLWSVFYDQAHIYVGQEDCGFIDASVSEYASVVRKSNGTTFNQSYFDHPEPGMEIISGVLLFNLPQPIKNGFDFGVRFDNPNAKYPIGNKFKPLTRYFLKQENPDRYFLDNLKKNGGIVK